MLPSSGVAWRSFAVSVSSTIANFRPFYDAVSSSSSNVIRPRHHDDYFVKGKAIIWEYPRIGSDGERSEFVESWELNQKNQIQRHRVYWGWSRIGQLGGKGFDRAKNNQGA